MNLFRLSVVRRDKRVRKVTREERYDDPNAGLEPRWTVEVLLYEQEMWYPIEHAAQFKTQAEAERLAARVKKAMMDARDRYRQTGTVEPGKFAGLDLQNWIWSPSVTCPFADLQKEPTAEPYDA